MSLLAGRQRICSCEKTDVTMHENEIISVSDQAPTQIALLRWFRSHFLSHNLGNLHFYG